MRVVEDYNENCVLKVYDTQVIKKEQKVRENSSVLFEDLAWKDKDLLSNTERVRVV